MNGGLASRWALGASASVQQHISAATPRTSGTVSDWLRKAPNQMLSELMDICNKPAT